MDFLKVKNRASSTLASGISDSDLSLTVATGEGVKFPSTYPFHITIDDEILECTDNADNVLTVTRAAESTVAASHLANAAVSLNITAQIITDFQNTVDVTLDGGSMSEPEPAMNYEDDYVLDGGILNGD